MPSRPGSQLLNRAERKFGHWALHGLLRWIGGFQLLVFGLLLFSDGEYGLMVDYHPDKILSGEVWRLFSYVFIPRTTSILLILIAIMFLFFISDSLENAWGSFRLNVYVIATVVLLSIAGFLPFLRSYVPIEGGGTLFEFSPVLNYVFYSSSFLAFATLFPNQVINLFLVIPIKVKWLGYVNAALLLVMVLGDFRTLFLVGAGLLPYFVVFVPEFLHNLRQNSENAARRHAYQQKLQEATGESFHTCEACGKTDTTNPELEFRVTEDGTEFCENCLPSRKNDEVEA